MVGILAVQGVALRPLEAHHGTVHVVRLVGPCNNLGLQSLGLVSVCFAELPGLLGALPG